MGMVSAWVRTLAVLTVFCGVVRALVPAGRLKGAFSVLCALVVFASALRMLPDRSALRLPFGLVSSDEAVVAAAQEDETRALLLASQEALREAMETALNDAGFVSSVAVRCAIRDDAVFLERAEISGVGTDKREAASKILLPFLSEGTTVVWKEENGE